MKKKIVAGILLTAGFGFIIWYGALKYNIEGSIPADQLLLGGALLLIQLGLGYMVFKTD